MQASCRTEQTQLKNAEYEYCCTAVLLSAVPVVLYIRVRVQTMRYTAVQQNEVLLHYCCTPVALPDPAVQRPVDHTAVHHTHGCVLLYRVRLLYLLCTGMLLLSAVLLL